MSKAKIIIAESNEKIRNSLKNILIKYGYSIVAEVNNAPELLRETRKLFPDLVIIASDIEGGSIFEVAGIIEYDHLAAVLIITDDLRNYSTDEFPQLKKPFSPETFLSVVEICLLYNQRYNSMKNEVIKLRENLENRKMIEKAKGILMSNMGISEEEAYSKMRKLSMDKSISMINIARAVIEADT
ncbi:MAG: ANTAR domain-containing protein [Syntrophomonadaceae bacterium]|nr:ANTAR domain-containing protein [Syntrophomonadaceae bacterium]